MYLPIWHLKLGDLDMWKLSTMHAGGVHETGDAIMVMDMGQVLIFPDCSHDICSLLSLFPVRLDC